VIDKSDTFLILCIVCLSIAGFFVSPVVGFLVLGGAFAFFALAADDGTEKRPGEDA